MERPVRGSATFERDVQKMFSAIARRYTLFDHLSTGGGDLVWRPRALWTVDRMLDRPPRRILDVGCGPGDFTYLLSSHYRSARVVATDFTWDMVAQGERERGTHARAEAIRFGVADVQRLPFRTGSFDLVTSGFLLRNLSDLGLGFSEMARVLRPGGVMLALDITEPTPAGFRDLFHAYFDRVMPILGAAFWNEQAYRYLSDSLRHFPPREKVREMLLENGFAEGWVDPQWFGVVTGFLGRKTTEPSSRVGDPRP